MTTIEERTGAGVSFGLTDEQKALRDLAHDFAEREIRPKEREYDEHSTHPAEVIAKAHELGLMNVHIPRAYGGLELGAFEGMLIGEELCWGCSGIGTAIAAAGLGHGPVILAGTEEQKQTWLPPLVDEVVLSSFALTEPNAGSDVWGVARAALERAAQYSKERVQFGMPIAMNQCVNFLIADMATKIEAARLLCWQAAWMIDNGLRATLQSSYAKRFAADTCMEVTTDAVQIFGGYGYMKEYPVEKLMRDAKLFQIYEGTSQIQRLVIAREIFFPRD